MPILNHVALLVPSVVRAAEALRGYGFSIGEVEEWEGELTREIYVGYGAKASLLLMEPAGETGSYRRALEKRGPGLHHLAVDVQERKAEELPTEAALVERIELPVPAELHRLIAALGLDGVLRPQGDALVIQARGQRIPFSRLV